MYYVFHLISIQLESPQEGTDRQGYTVQCYDDKAAYYYYCAWL